eukprot:scaffold740_cov405-Prasinococcus_capsulatus_cf.AAC.14
MRRARFSGLFRHAGEVVRLSTQALKGIGAVPRNLYARATLHVALCARPEVALGMCEGAQPLRGAATRRSCQIRHTGGPRAAKQISGRRFCHAGTGDGARSAGRPPRGAAAPSPTRRRLRVIA